MSADKTHTFQIGISAKPGELIVAAEEAALAVNTYLAKVEAGIATETQVVVSLGSAPNEDVGDRTVIRGFADYDDDEIYFEEDGDCEDVEDDTEHIA